MIFGKSSIRWQAFACDLERIFGAVLAGWLECKDLFVRIVLCAAAPANLDDFVRIVVRPIVCLFLAGERVESSVEPAHEFLFCLKGTMATHGWRGRLRLFSEHFAGSAALKSCSLYFSCAPNIVCCSQFSLRHHQRERILKVADPVLQKFGGLSTLLLWLV